MVFEIRECEKSTWKYFGKYHYLSDKLPGGFIKTYGLYHNNEQIGFQCFAEYVPWKDKRQPRTLHSNRTVIHPDYVGFGLGIKLINLTSQMLHDEGYKIMAKFSSLPVYKAMSKIKEWKLVAVGNDTSAGGGNMTRDTGFRKKVKWYSFIYVPEKGGAEAPPIN